MGWQAYILLHALASGLQNLQFRAIARDRKHRRLGLEVNAVSFSALFICGLLILPLVGTVSSAEFTSQWPLFVVSSMFFVIALYFMYKSLTHLESATASVLGTMSALFVVILAKIFYNDHLSAAQIFGITMLLPCLWYVLLLARRHHKLLNFKDINWLHGFYYVVGSSFFLALAHIIEREILLHSNLATYLAYGWALQAAWSWLLVFLVARRASFKIFKDYKLTRNALQLGVLRAATGLFFLQALILSSNVSLVTVVANFRIIVVAVLAGWLLGEKKYYFKKLAAAALSVVALSIIFWN